MKLLSFMHPPPMSLEPRELMPSAAHQFSILYFYSEPHKLIVIHVSSTIEFGTPQIDCRALFAYSPPSKSCSETHELIA